MVDILLGKEGDILVSENGDISLTGSVRQAVLIRLRWFFAEWRLGPELGFPWFEEVLVKNPNLLKIKGLIRNEIMKVNGVRAANVEDISFDPAARTAKVRFTCDTEVGIYREEVALYARLWAYP